MYLPIRHQLGDELRAENHQRFGDEFNSKNLYKKGTELPPSWNNYPKR